MLRQGHVICVGYVGVGWWGGGAACCVALPARLLAEPGLAEPGEARLGWLNWGCLPAADRSGGAGSGERGELARARVEPPLSS
jgi:hypothetical protein